MVGREYRDECCAPVGVIAGINGKLSAFIFQQMPGIALNDVVWLGYPIGFG